jgi:precorrin-3B C17-methyltransferase
MIYVVGIGFSREHLTFQAANILKKADLIIGHPLHLKQIEDLIMDKKTIGSDIKKEEMVNLSILESLEGKKVVLVSSEDPGADGIVNILYQSMDKYPKVDVKVVPGITATSYASAILGAPLHDFAVISLNDDTVPLCEIELKLKKTVEAELILILEKLPGKNNPLHEEVYKILKRFKTASTPVGMVELSTVSEVSLNSKKNITFELTVTTLEDIQWDDIGRSTILVVGNKFTYVQDGSLVTARGYIIPPVIHPLTRKFYEKYLDGEGVEGPNFDCPDYPCHQHPQNCTFCYCPFYPCGDSITGGKWIKGKSVWDCTDCLWIHEDDTVDCIQGKLDDILHEVEDLQNNKKELLKLRRECLYHTLNLKNSK